MIKENKENSSPESSKPVFRDYDELKRSGFFNRQKIEQNAKPISQEQQSKIQINDEQTNNSNDKVEEMSESSSVLVNERADDSFEKKGYTARTYRKVNKMRERGKHFGFVVPYVNYELSRPKKPRILYIVLGILCFIAAAAFVVFAILGAFSMLPTLFTADTSSDFSSPWDPFHIVSGVATGLANTAVLLAIIVVLALLLVMAAVGYFLVKAGLNCLDLSKATMEEVGYSPFINNSINRWGIVGIAILASYITLAVTLKNGGEFAFSVGGIVLVLISLFFFAIMGVTIGYKFKAQKWLKENVSEENRENYIAHTKALKRAIMKDEMRKSTERNLWR